MKSAEFSSFQPDSVCTICDAKLPGLSQAQSHYASQRHFNNVQLYEKKSKKSASSSSSYQPLTSVATINAFNIPTAFQMPVKSSNEYFETFDCDLCDLKIPSMVEQIKHIEEFPHCHLVAIKTILLDKGIEKEFYSFNKSKKIIHCILCRVDMTSDEVCKQHLNGKKHLEKFDIWSSDQQMQISPKPSVNSLGFANYAGSWDSISVPKTYSESWGSISVPKTYSGSWDSISVPKRNTETEHQSDCKPKSVSSDPLDEIITCYICNTSFVASMKKEHMKNFPHADLAVMRTQLIKLGISKQFYSYSKKRNTIICTLCNAAMPLSQVVKSHLGGKRHITNFTSWCAEQPVKDLPSQSASKWYYCNVCALGLDGTSDAAKHYKTKSHLKRVAKTPVEDFKTNLTQTNVNQNNLNLEETANVKLSEHTLKTQIFDEIGKLVQTLYFSKKVPYEVSLQHLKKINRDIEDIVKKHQQKKPIYSSCDISCDKPVSSEVKNSTIENEFILIEPRKQSFEIVHNYEEIPLDEKLEPIIDNPKTAPEILRIVNNGESCDKSVSSEVNDTTEETFFFVESQGESFKTANNSDETPLDQKQPETIIDKSIIVPEILRIVEMEKSRIKQDTSALEVEILVEVDELLKQIEEPNAPFKEILKYLKTFNEVLEDLSNLEKEIICE